ncbi:MAG: DEAD/DEAH box helicase family protein [Gracilibacteraceae bacterium]|jgi:superfamily II DNA or RNA helicase|nr:DEAD/DEAH box helicase family protein [Gracilibacteraceae bacterium]
MINPFPWQEECLAAWLAAGGRGIAHVATGAGKTVMALMAVRALEERLRTDLRVKVVVPKVFLAAQWAEAIVKIYGAARAEVGICSGAVKESSRKFTVYVVNTARLCAARHIAADFAAGRAVFLIGDECHRLGSEENAHVFDFLPLAGPDNYFALGLSATPDCERYENVIVPALGREIYGYDIREAAAARVVADFAAHGVGLAFTEAEAGDYEELTEKLRAITKKLLRKCPFLRALSGNKFLACLNRLAAQKNEIGSLASAVRFLMFRRKEIVYLARTRVLCAVELAKRQPAGSRVIFFLERIEMADELYAALLPVYGGRICRYHSEMSDEEKRRALDAYRDGEALALVCCRWIFRTRTPGSSSPPPRRRASAYSGWAVCSAAAAAGRSRIFTIFISRNPWRSAYCCRNCRGARTCFSITGPAPSKIRLMTRWPPGCGGNWPLAA